MLLADTLNEEIELNTEYWQAAMKARAITASRFSDGAFFLKRAHEERKSSRAAYAACAAQAA
jgi:hypothetical protein